MSKINCICLARFESKSPTDWNKENGERWNINVSKRRRVCESGADQIARFV
ncbi:hypothetical protein RchiOBHm_Chr1g0378021 [Rosa chinensis]|uniref:Uncharacterized protein n=1 Tax=Rosa chinensis TaxID=74649 RepID=A0A2P6SN72_ROSCH|nr:hypothetical protein RchiOBHm_Chr1g0378021 [Rosa chinensis]